MSALAEPVRAEGTVWTTDGGARQPEADLWCSYAAVRALTWLGERPDDTEAVSSFLLSRRNADGAFAWQRGLPSDVWATYYCTQALRDLGHPVADLDRLAAWLERLRTPDGGFAMTPGQSADVWATYYGARIHAEVVGAPVAERGRLAAWLRATQDTDGGLAWSPGSRMPDVRASYYGALAWRAAAGTAAAPWQVDRLVAWVRDRQRPDGGFASPREAARARGHPFAPRTHCVPSAHGRAIRRRCAPGSKPAGCTATPMSGGRVMAAATCGRASRSSARLQRSASGLAPTGGRRRRPSSAHASCRGPASPTGDRTGPETASRRLPPCWSRPATARAGWRPGFARHSCPTKAA